MSRLPRPGLIILATVFVNLVVTYGVWYSYSVFLVALIRELGWSRSLVAGAFSFFVLTHGACATPVGWLLRRVGSRRILFAGGLVLSLGLVLAAETREWWHLYLGYGVVAAVGMSLGGWVPAVVLVRGWFPRQVGSAMGIATAGIGMGILGFVPLTQLLIGWWGWRCALRIQALIVAAWLLPSTYWLIQDPPVTNPNGETRAKDPTAPYWTLPQAIRTSRFWLLAGVYFTGNFVTQMLLIHQVAYLVDHGVPAMRAATVGGAVGLVSIAAKVGWGALSDRAGREVVCALAFGSVVASLGVLVLAGWYQNAWLLYGYAVFIGLGYGVLSPVFPAAASDLFGGPGFSTIYGALYSMICLGLGSGAWIAGKTFDWTGTYAPALWLGLFLALMTPSLMWLAAPRRPNPPRP